MKRTEEERREWRSKMSELAKTVAGLSEERREEIALRMGTVTAEGHPLSAYNCCMLWTQAGRALAQVGGFRQWQKAGRRVRPGEHAVGYIYVPLGKRGTDAEPTGDESEAGRLRFRLVPVFDVTQTEGVA